MPYFVLITGIASLISLVLQFSNLFPEYKEAKKTIMLIITGVFGGTLISVVQGTHVSISMNEVDPNAVEKLGMTIIIVILSVILGVILFTTLGTKEDKKRSDLLKILAWGSFIYIFIFFIASITVFHTSMWLSSDEMLFLVTQNVDHGNNERAIALLGQYKQQFSSSDPRFKDDNDKIKEIMNKQLLMPNKTGQ